MILVHDNIQRAAALSLNHAARLWEEELGTAITLVHSSSICVRHGLLQFKVLHRPHLSASKLAKLFPGSDPICIRCRQDPATLSHMFWLCPKLSSFWTGMFDTLSYLCNKTVSPNPLTALFGVIPQETSIASYQTEAVAFSTLLARRLILLSRKKVPPPLLWALGGGDYVSGRTNLNNLNTLLGALLRNTVKSGNLSYHIMNMNSPLLVIV